VDDGRPARELVEPRRDDVAGRSMVGMTHDLRPELAPLKSETRAPAGFVRLGGEAPVAQPSCRPSGQASSQFLTT
jgi:hypothetical protein